MSHNWQNHVIHAAAHQKDSKFAAVVMIVMGFAFTPFLIGIPLMIVGFHRLMK